MSDTPVNPLVALAEGAPEKPIAGMPQTRPVLAVQ